MGRTDQNNPYRLPDNVIPIRYSLEISPDIASATFSGTVDIEVEVATPTDNIVLNCLELNLEEAAVNGTAVDSISADAESERATLTLTETLEPGAATIHITFDGELNDKLMGFYRSTFELVDPNSGSSTEATLAVTQFESTHARAAFPCFDEPELKATFKISLIIASDLFAVSNGAEVERIDLGDGTTRVEFAETMRMSTYLVAFVVGPLVATEPRIVSGVAGPIPLRVIHTPGSEHLCEFALDVAEAALNYYEGYYGIPYPGDKVDMVAVPDFAFGAMENLGCITFREVLLLIDPNSATQPELQRVADVINHELAHMWFGDLVTMKWWNGIWLNEAFATFMENMASDSFNAGWDVWTNFGLARAAAFDTDALASTRPIEYEVISPADSEGMFDVLTYQKGASVVRMLEQYLGAEVFRQGISAYLHEHAYSTTETTDLWDALEKISGQPVRRIMDGWIFQGGHPLVTVEATDAGIRLSQEPFRYQAHSSQGHATGQGHAKVYDTDNDDAGSDDAGSGSSWAVPMNIRYRTTGGDISTRVLLEEPTEIAIDGRATLVQANVGGSGFYRTLVSSDLRSALAADTEAGPLERFVLIDDTYAALDSGHVGTAEVADVLAAVGAEETHPAVWRRIGGALRGLHRLGAPTGSAELIMEVTEPGLQRVKNVLFNSASAPEESARAQEVRGVIAALRGTLGASEHVREHTRQIFEMGEPAGPVDASLFAAAIEVVGYWANSEDHEELRRRWRSADTPQDELRYLTALVDTPDRELFELTLDMMLGEIRSQNAPYLLSRAIGHRSHASVAWGFIAGNWDRIANAFPTNSLPRMLSGIRVITDRPLAERVQHDLAAISIPAGHKQVDQHLERMWVSVETAERVTA